MTTTAAVSTPPARRIPCTVLGTGFDEAECRWFMVFEADGTGERLCLREPRGTALLDRARWVLGLGPGDGPGRGRRGTALRTLGAEGEDLEGIESEDGARRATLTGLCRAQDVNHPSAPDRAVRRLRRAAETAEAEARALRARLAAAEAPGGTTDRGDGTPWT